jgi:hypothetical protein
MQKGPQKNMKSWTSVFFPTTYVYDVPHTRMLQRFFNTIQHSTKIQHSTLWHDAERRRKPPQRRHFDQRLLSSSNLTLSDFGHF